MKDSDILGQKIKDFRPMTKSELKSEYWAENAQVFIIELENGLRLFPSRDSEGNGGGTLFGSFDGEQFGFGG